MKCRMYLSGLYEQKWICTTLLMISILFIRNVSSTNNCIPCKDCLAMEKGEDCFCKMTTLFHKERRWNRYYGEYEEIQGDKLYSFLTCENMRQDSILGNDVCIENDCKYITFLNSDIKVLRVNSFVQLSHIQEIFLNSSGIQQIQLGAFSGIAKLQVLHLKDNKIDKISKGSLNSLIYLKVLNLHKNGINLIESESFVGLTMLETLDLSLNELRMIPEYLFDPLENLKKLNLSSNYLTIIDFNLHILQQLKTLDLSCNKIEILGECFSETNLNSLYLQENVISYLNESCFPTSLGSLNVRNNNITELENEVLKNLSKLTGLDLSRNQIKKISIELFKDCEQLQRLDMSQNEIDLLKTGVFSGVPHLTFLNISYTKIKTLDLHTFIPLVHLKTFDFDNNELENIDTSILNHLTNLEDIYISGNNFSCSEVASIISLSKARNFTVVYNKNLTTENVNGLPCKKKNEIEVTIPKDNSGEHKSKNFFSADWKMIENGIVENITKKLNKDVKDLMNSEKVSFKNILNEFSDKHEFELQEYQSVLETERQDLKKFIIDSFSKHSKSNDSDTNSVDSKSIHKNIEKHFDAQNMKMEESFITFSKTIEKAFEKNVPKFENFAINSFKNIYNSTRAFNNTLEGNLESKNENITRTNQMESLSASIEQLKLFVLITCSICIFFYIVKNVSRLCWKRFRPDKGNFDLTHEMPILQNY